jgi:hypothetical protein
MSSLIETLNRRLADALGSVATNPRFQWRFAPEEIWMVYDYDDRTLIKKSWADMPSPAGGPIGRAWLLAEWRVSTAIDHHGYGMRCEKCNGEGRVVWGGVIQASTRCEACDGLGSVSSVRVAVPKAAGYFPYLETVLAEGKEPTEELNANYIRVLDMQIAMSAGVLGSDESMDVRLAEEKYTTEQNLRRDANTHLERSRGVYDDHVGAFGNCEVGAAGGFMSFGGVDESPAVKKLKKEAAPA